MYNRYIHSGRGSEGQTSSQPHPPDHCPEDFNHDQPHRDRKEKGGLLSSLLGRFKLDNIDSGDLLLIAIAVLLFRESEDEELLTALILLLIL